MTKAKSKSQLNALAAKERVETQRARTLELQELMGFCVIVHQVPKGTARKISYGVM